ncbi:inositol 1,4,5-triphosphate receptor associated 2 [Mobula birostris]|uniref:inositol 1,4,5-triphosphate receptor associated 2 n=1 Tax=Mobula birostris TaxID=1983395 RepID=UPI003B288B43
MENTEDTSLICEEDLLDTIFYSCDVKHQGKVCVSKIVDYLRHTTSRNSDDSGLEDLCNMLDPDDKDVSIDLDTYRAVMKEWVEDCRRKSIQEEMEAVSVTEDVLHHIGLGSGTKSSEANDRTVESLEAFGGEVSRGDLETSDLIACIADLQYNHQKLQEHNAKLRMTIDATEESNNRLMEENEELLSQIKSAQQSILTEKSLKEGLEDMKLQVSNLEETKERLTIQNKQAAKDNQSLIQKIASLQEENLRNIVDIDTLHEKIAVLSDEKTELQMQLTDLEILAQNKDAILLKRENHIKELKHSIVEYSMIIEGLRNEKSKLEQQLLVQQELASECINTSTMLLDGPEISGAPSSLQSELLNAFQEGGSEWTSDSDCIPATLERMLDEEVLMLLQGRGPEQAALRFKAITTQMATEVSEEIDALVTLLKQVAELEINSKDLHGAKLEHLQEKRQQWLQSIHALEEQKSASDQEYVRLASAFRRSKTEQLHFKRKEVVRRRQLEAQKEATERTATETSLQLQRVRQQLEALHKELCDKDAALASVQDRAERLQRELEAREKEHLFTASRAGSGAGEQLRSKPSQRRTILQSTQKRHSQQELRGFEFQTGSCCREQRHGVAQPEGQTKAPRHTLPFIQQGRNHSSVTTHDCTPLLDALMLEHFNPFLHIPSCVAIASSVCAISNSTEHQRPMTSATDEFFNSQLSDRCRLNPGGSQLNVELSLSGLSGELLPQAPADEGVCCNKLTPVSEDSDQQQLSSNREVTSESSTMSNPPAKKTNKSPQQKEASKTLQNSTNACGVVKDGPLDGPLSSSAIQINTESSASDVNQPELKSKIKVNLEATRGTVAVDELSPSDVMLNPINTASNAEAGTMKTQCSDLSKKANLQSAIASEQDVEAEFLRFSLAFKCDMFTLDKRLRLEERSRDLAETNLKKEIEKCQQALQTVRPLCEEEQSLEIFESLEKSLGVLTQTITRVVSRAEMLGAIHQETRVSKAVEVMIQYVENLKRMYAKEHAELEEMKQLLLQNGNTLNSLKEHQDDQRSKRFPNSQTYGRGSLRRVSIATIPRSNAGMQLELSSLGEIEEGRRKSEGDQDMLRNKLSRRVSNWKFLGQKPKESYKSRPSLQQLISTCTWGEKSNQLLNKGAASELEVQDDEEKSEIMETSTLTEPDNNRIDSPCTVTKGLSPHLTELWNTFTKNNRGPWLPVLLLFSLSVLGSFLIGWSLHTSVDAAAVGTGDSWKALQQFLWPYTGLQHNGQPPV